MGLAPFHCTIRSKRGAFIQGFTRNPSRSPLREEKGADPDPYQDCQILDHQTRKACAHNPWWHIWAEPQPKRVRRPLKDDFFVSHGMMRPGKERE